MKKLKLLTLALVAIVMFTGCADAVNVNECITATDHVYGFWGGTWHGLISFWSFIGSLFDADIAIYAVSNNGTWYNFGFVGGFWLCLKTVTLIMKQLTK